MKKDPPKNKLSLLRPKSFTYDTDLIQTDNVPSIDPSTMSHKDKIKVERMRYRNARKECCICAAVCTNLLVAHAHTASLTHAPLPLHTAQAASSSRGRHESSPSRSSRRTST